MNRTDKYTGTILVKANICSEWDSVNGCIVDIDKEKLIKWASTANQEDKDNQYSYAHTAYYYSTTWVNDDIVEELLGSDDWCHIEAEEEEIEVLNKPEQRVDSMIVKMYGREGCCWVGYGKHTSEELWTETISVNKIIK